MLIKMLHTTLQNISKEMLIKMLHTALQNISKCGMNIQVAIIHRNRHGSKLSFHQESTTVKQRKFFI